MNLLSGSAKLAIWLTRRNQAQKPGCRDPGMVLKGLMKARLNAEHANFHMTDNVQTFDLIWVVGGLGLCSVWEGREFILKFSMFL